MSRLRLPAGFALALTLFLVPLPWVDQHRLFQAGFDLLHFPLMAGLTFLLTRGRRSRSPAFLFLVLLAFQIAVEALQHQIGRGASIQDVLLGTAGVFLALAKHNRRVAIACICLPLLWLAGHGVDVLRCRAPFPVLTNGYNPFELHRWERNGLRSTWFGQWTLEKTDPNEIYPGITSKSFPSDWSGYSGMRLRLRGDFGGQAILRLDPSHDSTFTERWHFRFKETEQGWITRFDPTDQLDGNLSPLAPAELVRVTIFFPAMSKGQRIDLRSVSLLPRDRD